MNRFYSREVISSVLTLLWVLFSHNSFAIDENSRFAATSSTVIGCPKGFVRIPSGLACMATNITTTATADVAPGIDCPTGFERPLGVRFCIAKSLTLEIQNDVMLIARGKRNRCPKGFSRPVGSTICIADNLVLGVIDNEVKLMVYSGDCPKGFHRPVGSRFCTPKNFTAGELPVQKIGSCPPGFVRPPGVHMCIASELLYKDHTRRNKLVAPVGACPRGWIKPDNANFCQPRYLASGCGENCGSRNVSEIHVAKTISDFELVECPAGTVETWWDMPVYDESGLWVVDSIPTRTCVPEDLPPAG